MQNVKIGGMANFEVENSNMLFIIEIDAFLINNICRECIFGQSNVHGYVKTKNTQTKIKESTIINNK